MSSTNAQNSPTASRFKDPQWDEPRKEKVARKQRKGQGLTITALPKPPWARRKGGYQLFRVKWVNGQLKGGKKGRRKNTPPLSSVSNKPRRPREAHSN